MRAKFLGGVHQPLVALDMLRPDKRPQPQQSLRVERVDRVEVHSDAPADRDVPLERRQPPAVEFSLELHDCTCIAPAEDFVAGARVTDAVPVEVQVEARACPEVDQVQRTPVRLPGDHRERRDEARASAYDVRLRAPRAHQFGNLAGMRAAEIAEVRRSRRHRSGLAGHDRIVCGEWMRSTPQQQVLHSAEQHVRRRLMRLRVRGER